MINNAHQQNTFTICWAGDWSYCCPRLFLDEYNVKIIVDFLDCPYNKVVFSDILWENPQIVQNHIVGSFIVEQIEFFLDF